MTLGLMDAQGPAGHLVSNPYLMLTLSSEEQGQILERFVVQEILLTLC